MALALLKMLESEGPNLLLEREGSVPVSDNFRVADNPLDEKQFPHSIYKSLPSFISQRHHRIDLRRTIGRNIVGRQCDRAQQSGECDHCDRIVSTHAKQQA